MEKPAPVFTESRNIPVAIKRYVLWRDKGQCVKCGSASKCAFDHTPEWNLLIPKQHNPDWIWLLCKDCHDPKSARNTTEAARAKRLNKVHTEGKAPSKHPIKSGGFPKDRPKTKWPKRSFQNRKKEI